MNMENKNKFKIQVERNLKGIEFEKRREIEKAIELYEKNIEERFEGNHPYDRLAIIYRRMGKHEEEIRVLKTAIWVFENKVYLGRADREPKLKKFKERLEKAKKKLEQETINLRCQHEK